jgi:hypothetical protein
MSKHETHPISSSLENRRITYVDEYPHLAAAGGVAAGERKPRTYDAFEASHLGEPMRVQRAQ